MKRDEFLIWAFVVSGLVCVVALAVFLGLYQPTWAPRGATIDPNSLHAIILVIFGYTFVTAGFLAAIFLLALEVGAHADQ